MKRFAAWLLAFALLTALAACAPDNVLTPEPDNTQSEQTEKEPEGQKTDNTEQTEPEGSDESMTEGAKYLASKKENKDIAPSRAFDGMHTLAALAGGTELSVYVDDGESFWNIDEHKWLENAGKSYKIGLTLTKRPAAELYSSQIIAVKAGIPLDLIYCRADDFAAPLTLMQNIGDLASPEGDEPYVPSLFVQSGYKLMLPKGSCKALWYCKTKVNGDPLAEYFENVWTIDRLSQYAEKPLAAAGWLPFASASAAAASGVGEDGYFFTEDDGAYSAVKAFAKLSGGSEPLFFYGLSPDKERGQDRAVPIPRAGGDGRYAVSYAGGAMGLSLSLNADKRPAAAAFVKMWCARAGEARADSLIYGAGMTAADADAFLTFCDRYADAYEFDAAVNGTFGEVPVADAIAADGNELFAGAAEYRQKRLSLLNARR